MRDGRYSHIIKLLITEYGGPTNQKYIIFFSTFLHVSSQLYFMYWGFLFKILRHLFMFWFVFFCFSPWGHSFSSFP